MCFFLLYHSLNSLSRNAAVAAVSLLCINCEGLSKCRKANIINVIGKILFRCNETPDDEREKRVWRKWEFSFYFFLVFCFFGLLLILSYIIFASFSNDIGFLYHLTIQLGCRRPWWFSNTTKVHNNSHFLNFHIQDAMLCQREMFALR